MENSILHWNMRSYKKNRDILLYYLNNNSNIKIFCLNETFLSPIIDIKIPGFYILRQDRQDDDGGIAVGIQKSIPFNHLDLNIRTPDRIQYLAIETLEVNIRDLLGAIL